MPITTPKKGEEKNDFISRCIKQTSEVDVDRPQEQIIAICYSQWREYEERRNKKKSKQPNRFSQ